MSAFIDLTGERFGRLLVLKEDISQNWDAVRWKCQCDCGRQVSVRSKLLRSGKTKSCGCFQIENTIAVHTKHGQSSRTPEYRIWAHMISRCHDQGDKAFKNYGGRGIYVCQEWRDFSAFFQDMGKRKSTGYTLERVDNSKGYSKANCKWASRHEQSRNKRNNRYYTHDGINACIADWANILRIDHRLLSYHLNKGRSIAEAMKSIRRLNRPT